METIKKYLPWTIRIIIFVLFMLSGVAKMFPLWAFEKQLVDLGMTDWCGATYFARIIIAIEIAIGIAILQPHYLKRLVIPSTILLLVAFCIHLSMQMYEHGAMNGNCGCFGQLIPMTPLEAFIKNILTIGMLIYLYRNVTEKRPAKFINLVVIFLASALFMFIFFPFCPCPKQEAPVLNTLVTDTTSTVAIDTVSSKDTVSIKTIEKVAPKEAKKDSIPVKILEKAPKKVTSRFSAFTSFGDKQIDLNEGKKIVCMFAPGCDHCQATAKTLCGLSAKGNFPEVYILFMDEETEKIPEFFKMAQCNFPYQVLDIPKFWDILGMGKSTPGVLYLWNGNIIKSYDGIDKNQFNAEDLKKALSSKGLQ